MGKAKLERNYPITIPYFNPEKITMIDENGTEKSAIRKPLSAQSVVKVLDNQLLIAGKMDDAIFTTGVGIHQMVAAQLITWTKPRQMLSSGSLGGWEFHLDIASEQSWRTIKKFAYL